MVFFNKDIQNIGPFHEDLKKYKARIYGWSKLYIYNNRTISTGRDYSYLIQENMVLYLINYQRITLALKTSRRF